VSAPAPNPPLLAAVTGVTGYVGGRLVPELLEAGFSVRAVARKPERLRDRPWRGDVEVAQADVGELEQVRAALAGADVAYYLVHSLGTGPEFEARDRHAALMFGQAAREAGVRRIVYLGGMYPKGEKLSPHLGSRKEVGDILLASGVPTTVLQAAVILGSGSASFEMMRYLTERLPAMVAPKWITNRIQPIGITDVLRYLVGSATMPPEVNRAFDIGGRDVLTYQEMMQRYAKVEELPHRLIVSVPVLTPWLSSHWVSLVTPVPAGIAKPLVLSLVHEVVCSEHDIADYVPDPPDGLLGFDEAVSMALRKISQGQVETRWSSAAVHGAPADPLPSDPDWAGGSLYTDDRETRVAATPEQVWSVVTRIGGETGWYSWPQAWQVRGVLDRIAGGPGLRRGRRDATRLSLDDAVDFWRVEEVVPHRLLRLRAEMRLPGLAWLELSVRRDEDEPSTRTEDSEGDRTANDGHEGSAGGGSGGDAPGTVLRQRAVFYPHGLAGQAYWWSVTPFHGVVFGSMLAGMKRAAEALAAESPATAELDAARSNAPDAVPR
jgi:uncharacterized protein YbjT (DUF2867 family)